jgi:hypothetical protein
MGKQTKAANRPPTAPVVAPPADTAAPAVVLAQLGALLAQLPGYSGHNGASVATSGTGPPEGFMTEEQMRRLLRGRDNRPIHQRTLARWRERGQAPPRIQLPGQRGDLYCVASFLEWLRKREEKPLPPPRGRGRPSARRR